MALYVNNVTKTINQVATTVNLPTLVVKQFSAPDLATNDDEIAKVVNLKSTHDVSKLKVWNLPLHSSLFYACHCVFNSCILRLIFFVRNVLDNILNQVYSIRGIDFSRFVHNNLHVGLL